MEFDDIFGSVWRRVVGTLHEDGCVCFLAHFECNWQNVIGMKSDWYKRSREKRNMYCAKYTSFLSYTGFLYEEKGVNKPKLLHHV
jgi:hypothetical protein